MWWELGGVEWAWREWRAGGHIITHPEEAQCHTNPTPVQHTGYGKLGANLARIPQYVVPLTVCPSTLLWKATSFDTTAAVRWLVMPSQVSSTLSSSDSLYSVTTCEGEGGEAGKRGDELVGEGGWGWGGMVRGERWRRGRG